jgi:Fic family protein
MSCLDQFEKYVQTKDGSEIPLLVQLALIHYQFETIHPFPDGNGRVGRLIIPLILLEKRELPHPLLHLSPYFEANRDQYVDHLLKVSRSGSWIEWIRFFLQGVIVQCHDTIVRVQRLQDLQTDYRERLQHAGRSARTIQLADYLFEQPIITIPHAQRILAVTYPSAANNVKRLSDAKILTQLSEFTRTKFFIAGEIVSVLYADEGGEIH